MGNCENAKIRFLTAKGAKLRERRKEKSLSIQIYKQVIILSISYQVLIVYLSLDVFLKDCEPRISQIAQILREEKGKNWEIAKL